MDGFDLAQDIGIIPAAKSLLVQGIEHLSHVDAVQPDLVGVDGLVPEIPLHGSGLTRQVALQVLRRQAVFFLPGGPVQGQQHPALVDVVQVVFLRLVGTDGAVGQHIGVDEALHKVEVFPLPGDFRHAQQGGHHAAVDVVPAALLPFPELFNVPDGPVRGGLLNQPVNIIVNFLIHRASLHF